VLAHFILIFLARELAVVDEGSAPLNTRAVQASESFYETRTWESLGLSAAQTLFYSHSTPSFSMPTSFLNGNMSLLRFVLSLCVVAYTVTASPLQNITLPLPAGTSNHGTPGLLCTPTKWTDIALFFLFNYVAHAATVLTRPGERSDDSIASVVGCLLFPVLGLYRGLEAIFSGAVFVKNDDLRKAARSGALCMVVRGNDWRPVDGDAMGNAVFKRAKAEPNVTNSCDSTSTLSDHSSLHILIYSPPWINSRFGYPMYVYRQIVHGTYNLPQGYRLVVVPSDAQFTSPSVSNSVIEVSATYSLVKALIALVQSGYAFSTLYRSRGDQIQQFGYAAFGLTVAPYAVMSVVNLLGNICRPEYPSLYLMENSIMDEARKRGGMFEGCVGRVQEGTETVCGCGLVDGDDADQLHFSADETGSLNATFETTSPALESIARLTPDSEKPCSPCIAQIPHSHQVKSLPPKFDYNGTEDDALLVLPCCNPIQRSPPTSAIDDTPARHSISALKIHRIPLCKPYHWSVVFAPNFLTRHTRHWNLTKYFVTLLISLTPFAIAGALSRFQLGSIPPKESSTWRSYAIQELVVSVWCGIWWVYDQEVKDASPNTKNQFRPLIRILLYILSGSAAVGVFVCVGQMIARYGVCVWVGD
jgi:hypothetical protein